MLLPEAQRISCMSQVQLAEALGCLGGKASTRESGSSCCTALCEHVASLSWANHDMLRQQML